MTVWWVSLTLELFQLRGSVVTAATNFLTAQWSIGSVALSIGGLLRFGVTLWVAILLSRAAAFILAEEVAAADEAAPGCSGRDCDRRSLRGRGRRVSARHGGRRGGIRDRSHCSPGHSASGSDLVCRTW